MTADDILSALMANASLTDTLATLNLKHIPSPDALLAGSHDVVDSKGVVLTTGTANDVWAWLREQAALGLEVEAADLDARAARKDMLASSPTWSSLNGASMLQDDAAIFRDEAKSKRAKAQRLRDVARHNDAPRFP
jgi:hypothetical protein